MKLPLPSKLDKLNQIIYLNYHFLENKDSKPRNNEIILPMQWINGKIAKWSKKAVSVHNSLTLKKMSGELLDLIITSAKKEINYSKVKASMKRYSNSLSILHQKFNLVEDINNYYEH